MGIHVKGKAVIVFNYEVFISLFYWLEGPSPPRHPPRASPTLQSAGSEASASSVAGFSLFFWSVLARGLRASCE